MFIFKNFFFIVYCILLSEVKYFLKKIEYISYFLKNISFTKFIIFYFNKNKYLIFKSKSLVKYLQENQRKWDKLKHKVNNEKLILIENFINQAAYGMSNAIIGKYLSKLNKKNLIGFIREGDLKGEAIFKSFGIDKIIIFKKKNFFQRIQYILLSFKICKNANSIEKFLKIKIDNVDIGLPSYDSFIRYTGIATSNKLNSELILFLSDSLYAYYEFNKIIKKYNFDDYIQSETAFSPLNIFFQLSLKNKIKVYTRLGTDEFSIRKYDNFKQKYFYRANISKKLFNEVHSNFKKKCLFGIKNYYKSLQKKGFFGQDLRIRAKLKNKLKPVSKNEILKTFNWNKDKKIVIFFFNHLIDVNFHSGPRTIFKDNYTWSKFILNKMINLKKVNWIIKDHPSQPYYKSKLNFHNKVKILEKKYPHIKSFDLSWDPTSLKQISDIAITSHGTAGIEYPSFGIRSIYLENSFYSNVNIVKKITNLNELNKELDNLHNFKKLSKDIISKSNTFLYIKYILLLNKCSLISKHDTSRQINEDKFWLENSKLIKRFRWSKDELFKMFKIQLKYNFRHTINLNKIKLKKKHYNDLNE